MIFGQQSNNGFVNQFLIFFDSQVLLTSIINILIIKKCRYLLYRYRKKLNL